MPGIKLLRYLQLGRETTAGTGVAATTIWRGMGTIEDQLELVHAEEDVGYISRLDRTYIPKLGAALSMESVPATFEQLPHLFEAGIKAVGTGAADSTGSGKIYDYPLPTTSKNTIKTYTIEGGDDQQEEEIEYAFVEKLSLAGKAGEALTMSADWKGRQVTVSTKTGALALPVVEEILVSKGKLYIDAVSGTQGTTQVSQSLLELGLELTTGWVPVWTVDGSLVFTFAKIAAPELVATLTFEHDTNAVAEKAAWRAQTPRLLQLKFEGSTLTTAGVYTVKTFIANLAGKWEKFDALADQDGNDVVKGTFRARYDPTAAKFANLLVVNQLTTIP